MNSRDLIKTAGELVAATDGKPRQSNLHRATSTAYYAAFHALAQTCADLLVGTSSAKRSDLAWRQVYRSLAHSAAREACTSKTMVKFPAGIREFANVFVLMQANRHDADYNPDHRTKKSAVTTDIAVVEKAIAAFEATPVKDRRAFAVWVLFKDRKS